MGANGCLLADRMTCAPLLVRFRLLPNNSLERAPQRARDNCPAGRVVDCWVRPGRVEDLGVTWKAGRSARKR
jgi:hypothetical protein